MTRDRRPAARLRITAIAVALVLPVAAAAWAVGRVSIQMYEPWVPVLDAGGRPTGNREQPVPLGSLDFVTILIIGLDSTWHERFDPAAGSMFADIPAAELRGRTDSLMLVGLDRRTREVRLLHIPRDTLVQHPGRGEDKIGHYLMYYSFSDLKRTVENLLQIPVHRYVLIDFAGFESLVDAIGGVTLTIDHDLRAPTGVWLPKGTHRLDGARALRFVRHRYGELQADIDRIRHQKLFLVAVARELKEGGFKKVFAAYTMSPNLVKTNLAPADILRLWQEWGDYDPDLLEHLWLPGHPESHHWRVDPVKARRTVKEFWPETTASVDPTWAEARVGTVAPMSHLKRAAVGLIGVEAARVWDLAYSPYLRANASGRLPEVLIYHTHTSESFIPELARHETAGAGLSPDTDAFTDDLELSVARVGREIAAELRHFGFAVTHCLTVHDAEGRADAYDRSRRSAQAALEMIDGPVVILDLHRDAVTGRTHVGDTPAAEILLLVARQNAWWQWNYTFARNLEAFLEASAPGLSRGVRLLDGGYNTDLSPLAVIVEIGGAESTLAECLVSARILARVIADYLRGP